MPGKNAIWTSRRRRFRAASTKKKRLSFFYLAAALGVIAVLQVLGAGDFFPGRETLPKRRDIASAEEKPGESKPAGQPGPVAPVLSGSPLPRLWQKVLADNIPGLPSPPLTDEETVREVVLRVFRSVTGVDPWDPRSILERELGMGALASLPVTHWPESARPGTPEPGGKEAAPDPERAGEEKAPVFTQVFPFMGYNEPVGLVYHTHITESFVPTSGVRFSEDLDQTVARLGVELVRLLQKEYGLPMLHHPGIYDLPRPPAYDKARPSLKKILEENPRLGLVIDLHRDGVRREITTAEIDGRQLGKILIVVGDRHPNWESNFAFARCLQRELERVAPGISRGIRQQGFVYNQDLHPHAILVEVGGHENTLEEAMGTLPYLAEALARAYYYFFVED